MSYCTYHISGIDTLELGNCFSTNRLVVATHPRDVGEESRVDWNLKRI